MSAGVGCSSEEMSQQVPNTTFPRALLTAAMPEVTAVPRWSSYILTRFLTPRKSISLIKRIAKNLALLSTLHSLIQFLPSIQVSPIIQSQASSGCSKQQMPGPEVLLPCNAFTVLLFVIQKKLFFLSYISNCDQLFKAKNTTLTYIYLIV